MTAGLLAKTALFPLHLWLPPAHAGAPAPASAILSGLVVKGSFFILLRLWFNVLPGVPSFAAMQLLAALGAGAILFGNIVALRQERLKLLIAYSTLAQIGYLFLMFPLALNASDQLEGGPALAAGLLQAISHATAKAAMFLAVGSIYVGLGHDRVTGLRGAAQALPLSILTFAIGGLALIGVQPSGASLAKELLLQEAARTAQWWWAIVLQAGGMLTAAYVVLVLANALAPSAQPLPPRARCDAVATLPRSPSRLSLSLGLLPWQPYLPIPEISNPGCSASMGSSNCSGPCWAAPSWRSCSVHGCICRTSSAAWKTLTSPDRTVAADLSRDRQQGRKSRRCPSTMVRSGHLAAPDRPGLRRADVHRKVSIPASAPAHRPDEAITLGP